MMQPTSDAIREPLPAAVPPRWTIERMDLFIRTLRRTRTVAEAARAAGMSRKAAYALRARLRGHPFDRAWEAAMAPRTCYLRAITAHAEGDKGLQRVTQGNRG